MSTETETQTDQSAAEREAEVNYLEQEVNVFRPSTPFMRDNLKIMWGTFVVWLLIVFGPVTVAAIAPEAADAARIAGTPALFMMTAIGTPLGALLLAVGYAYQRDRLDEKYGIRHEQDQPSETDSAATADGGEPSETRRTAEDERSESSGSERTEGSQSSSEEPSEGGEGE